VASTPRTAAVAEVLGYIVLAVDGRRVAVPPRTLAVATTGWPLRVEALVDLAEGQEIAGRIGSTAVRVLIDRGARVPAVGECVHIDAERRYELE
jgi:hypothetical protein